MTDQGKKKLLIGLVCMMAAFLGVVTILYFLVNSQRAGMEEIDSLKKKIDILNAEKEVATRKSAEMEGDLGKAISLQKLIQEAHAIYGEEEKNRKEGYLWIDRETKSFIVTLGALNGLVPGSKLAVYDGDKAMGYLSVEIPLDVVAYVAPVEKTINEFPNDYYRVIIE